MCHDCKPYNLLRSPSSYGENTGNITIRYKYV